MHIYMSTNKVNGKKYIGMSTRNDNNYYGSGSLIHSAIKKYGKESFEKVILEECDSIESLSEAEVKWIKRFDAVNSDEFYNISLGGFGGNSDTVKKVWESRSKKEIDEIGNSISKGKITNKSHAGEKNPMYGKSTSLLVKKAWESRSEEKKKEIGRKSAETRKKNGTGIGENNPMYGRSAVSEKNLKWYTNYEINIYVTENTQPDGFVRGRKGRKKEC